jgi:carbohydrate kinase (thermoresistant glucokinase family)
MTDFAAPPSRVVIAMGVSGSGKTTVGSLLAGRLGWEFEEGDNLHPPENVAKMSAGRPLTDDDRWPWLRLIGEWIDDVIARGRSGVVSCSALKRSYRDLLCDGRPQVSFLYLDGDKDEIAARLAVRQGHYMPAKLLDSQFADLQPLQADEPGAAVSVAGRPEEIVAAAIAALGLEPAAGVRHG